MGGESLSLTAHTRQSLAPEAKINAVQFGILSPDQIRESSVVHVQHAQTRAPGSDVPLVDGLSDLRMGTTNPSIRSQCRTCAGTMDTCPGHFGHIELCKPVFHVGLIRTVLKVLNCVCFYCSKIRVDENHAGYENALLVKAGAKRLRMIESLCKGIKICEGGDELDHHMEGVQLNEEDITSNPNRRTHGGCGRPQPTYRVVGTKLTAEFHSSDVELDGGQTRRELSAEQVHRVLSRVSDDDCRIMGLDPRYARPDWMVITVLPVPPPPVRPSVVSGAGASEDDITQKLADIIKHNANLERQERNGAPAHIIKDLTELVQYHVATLYNNELPSQPQAQTRSGRPLKTLRQRLRGKQGRVRGNLMGKRVDFSARTVITPDPNLGVSQLGVPKSIAMGLTIPETVTKFNLERMYALVRNGPENYPGANYIIRSDGSRLDLRFVTRPADLHLSYGFKVERHLQDGDVVIFNRQPSLHKMSMMGHRIKVMPCSTFRLNLSVTPPYNADFDGDEMNMFVPQTLETRAEVSELMMVPRHIISPQGNKPVMGLVQDALLAARQFSRRNVFLEKDFVMNLLMWIEDFDGKIPVPAILRPKQLWTGKQLLSLIFPAINFQGRSSTHPDDEKSLISPSDTDVLVERGHLYCGILDKRSLGPAEGGLVHTIWLELGRDAARRFLNHTQLLANAWILHTGFTIGISDTIADPHTMSVVHNTIEGAKTQVKQLVEMAQKREFERQPGRTMMESFEARVNRVLNHARDNAGSSAQASLTTDNNVKCTVDAGSKGSFINISQMMACVGQQNVEGRRIPYGFQKRTLPHFMKEDYGPESRGFVENSYLQGLTPQEFFFHAMGGREGLIDTAVKTSETGYTQRKLVKAMEDVMVKYDGTVRNSAGQVIQFLYGEDGMDGCYVEKQSFGVRLQRGGRLIPLAEMSDRELSKMFEIDLSAEMGGSWIERDIWETISQSAESRRKLANEYERIIEDRAFMRSFMGNEMRWPLPVNLGRIIWNARKIFAIRDEAVSNLNPVDVVDAVEGLLDSLLVVRGEDDISKTARMNALRLFSINMHLHLSAKRVLRDHRLNQQALRWVLGEIETRFIRSLVAPGEMVGTLAAQSVGERVTQLTLNTFHYAGVSAKNVTLGVPRLKEIIHVSRNIKTPSLTIYLNSDVSHDSELVKGVQCALEHTTLRTVTSCTEIYYDPEPQNTLVEEDREFVRAYYLMPDQDIPQERLSRWLLRIELNRDMMLDKKLTIDEVRKKIQNEFEGDMNCIASDDNAEKLVLRLRVIDRGTQKEDNFGEEDDEFLRFVESNLLSMMTLQGIPEIKKVYMSEKDRVVFDASGFHNTKEWILETDGVNLLEVLAHPSVDVSRTITNDIVEAYKVLGIEAVRQVLMKELRGVLAFDGSYVNYRHVSLLCDVMTSRGYLMAVSRHGINSTDAGPLSKSTFEQTVEVLMNASAFSEMDPLRGISENIMLGQLAPMGTGEFELFVDQELLAQAMEVAGPEEARTFHAEVAPGMDAPATPFDMGTPQPLMSPLSGSPMMGVFSPMDSPQGHGMAGPSPNPHVGDFAQEAGYSPSSPVYSPMDHASPKYASTSPMYNVSSPAYSPASPGYSPTSPGYSPTSPMYSGSPSSPGYSPTSPSYSPSSPAYSGSPSSPGYSPTSPSYSPSSPAYSGSPSSPGYSPTSPSYSPSSPAYSGSPSSPGYSPTSPSYSPSSPAYSGSPTSPGYSPTSPGYSPTSPSYSPTSPAGGISPVFSPASPSYSPTSPGFDDQQAPGYSPTSPGYSPASPGYSPSSPRFSPDDSTYDETSLGSPAYSPNSSMHGTYSPDQDKV